MISTIIVRGFGSFGGGVNKVPTRGYTSGTGTTLAERDVRFGVSYTSVSPPAPRDVRLGVTY